MFKQFGLIPSSNAGRLTVHGGHASSYEVNVARALDTLGYQYIFQYDILGGRRLRGGSVIDFLVFTVPLPTPIFVNGDYWHTDRTQEFYQKALVEDALRGQANPVIVLWGRDCSTYAAALSALRRELR